MTNSRNILTTYVVPAISIVVIALLIALSRTVSGIFNIVLGLYIGAFFAYFIGRSILTFRKRMQEVREYLRNIKSGAIERLGSSDIAKLMEKDTEFLSELASIQKKQFKSLMMIFVAILAVFLIYSSFLHSYIEHMLSGIQGEFLKSFTESIIYLAILFGVYIAFVKIFKISPQMASNIPYTPMKSLVIYKDAIILDDIYLLKAPVPAKNVVINDYRKYIEIELDDEYSKKLQLKKIRIYVKNPRELWNDVLSKIVQIKEDSKQK